MLNRRNYFSFQLLSSVALIAGVLFCASSAHAGFQWVSPSSETDIQQPSSLAAPVPPPQQLSPAPPPSQPITRAPQSYDPPLVIQGAPKAEPSAAAKEKVLEEHFLTPPPSAVATPSDSAPPKETVVRGFANNVPLSVALRQILPPEYGFSVSQDVQLSTLVSWQGGRPWKPILEDTLKSVGLAMREQGKMIQIVRGEGKPANVLGTMAETTPAPSYQPAMDNKPVHLLSPPVSQTLQAPRAAMAPIYTPQSPVSSTSVVDTWSANRGDTLHKVLENWSRRANVELSWQAEYDYPLQASVTLTGTYEDVVRSLLTGFQEAQPQPVAALHNSPVAGQTVLVVQTRGNNYSE